MELESDPTRPLHLVVNHAGHDINVPDRRLLHDALRHDCGPVSYTHLTLPTTPYV